MPEFQSQPEAKSLDLEGQRSSLVANWLSIAVDHGSNPGGGEIFLLSFLSGDLMIAVYLRYNI